MLNPISSPPSLGHLGAIGQTATPAAPARLEGLKAASEPTASFGSVLDHLVSEVDGKMAAASSEQSRLLSGQSTSLHHTMISLQEASTAFTLMVEVRNKLVEGYQELMRLQV